MRNYDDDYWDYVNSCGDDEGGNYNFSGGGCGMGCLGYVIVAVLVIIVLSLLVGVEMNEAVIEFFFTDNRCMSGVWMDK